MKQLKLATVIAIAIVSSGSIVGCGGDRTIAEETIAQTSETSDAVSQEVRRQWETVQASSEELSAAIDSLNAELQGNVNDANIDFQTVTNQLNEFRIEVANLQSQLEAENQFPELVTLTVELTTIADEMDRVVDPLQRNLNEESVGQVQDILEMQVGQYRGIFGPDTKAFLGNYLVEQRDRLNNNMAAINNVIATPAETGDRPPVDSNPTSVTVEAENQQLREYLNSYYTELMRLRRQVFFLTIATIALVLAMVGIVVLLRSQRNRRRKPKFRQENGAANAVQDNNSLVEIYDSLDRLTHQQETILQRLKQLERQPNYNRVPSPSPPPYRGYDPLVASPSPSFSPSPTPTWDDRSQTQPQLPPQQSGSPYDQLISLYNHNPSAIASQATGVSETKDSIEARRAGRSQRAVFTQDRRGNYWVVQVGSQSYLIPKSDIKINEHSFNAVQALFDCYGYQAGGSDNFTLVKPAAVVPVVQGKEWELSDRGTLQF